MPYTSSSSSSVAGLSELRVESVGSPTSSYKSLPISSVSVSRSGTNRNARRSSFIKNTQPYVWVRKFVPIKRTRKVRYFDDISHRWRTRVVSVLGYRLIKIKRYRKKRPTIVGLITNDLLYQKSELVQNDDIYLSFSVRSPGYSFRSCEAVCKAANLSTSALSLMPPYVAPIPYSPGAYGNGFIATDPTIQSRLVTMESAAISSLFGKVKDQSVNLQNALAEINKTKSSFVDIVQRIAKVILAAKSGRLRQAAGYLFPTSSKEMADDWLLWQYGIKPLLSDIDGMCKQLAKNGGKTYYTVSSTVSDVYRPNKQYAKDWYYSSSHTLSQEFNLSVRAVANLRVDDAAMATLGQLGLGNLLATGWEVVPWSFVIDWLWPIGNWLNNLDAFTGVSVESSHVTYFVRGNVTCESSFGGNFGGVSGRDFSVSPTSCTWKKDLVYCKRLKKALPVTPPIPHIKSPVSVGHALNALALVTQLLSNRR